MFTSGEYERINEELNHRLFSKGQKLKKVWITILLIVSLISGILVLVFPGQFESGGTAWILPMYGGMAFLVALIGFLISMKYRSEKPYFEYLYDEIIQKINLNEGLFLEYQAYEKTDKQFNVTGGLFTRLSSIKVRRHLRGKSENEHKFDIYDCSMTTSNGKSQTTHFDGVYFVLHKDLNTSLQVRTNGSPKLKGVKYDRLKEFEDIKVYKPQDQNLGNIDHMFINYMKKLQNEENHKRVYVSIVEGAVHIALWYRKNPLRKPKTFDLTVLNRIAQDLYDEVKFVNEIEKIDHFDY